MLSAQCTFTSSDGAYSVTVAVQAVEVIEDRNPCPHGYNYNLRIDYNISFTGTVPGSLYTLQGYASCGAQSLYFDLPNAGSNTAGSVVTGANPWRTQSDCNTATPQSIGCNTTEIEIEGVNLSAQECNTSLPIHLTDFTANVEETGVELKWSTTFERNFSHFQVERASTEELSFEVIEDVVGKGGNDLLTSYTYLDATPSAGLNYYRLKHVDLDKTIQFSKIIAVNWDVYNSLQVYPNPVVDGEFQVDLGSESAGEGYVNIRITDHMGNLVYKNRLTEPTKIFQLQASLTPGIYNFWVESRTKRYFKKLSVIR